MATSIEAQGLSVDEAIQIALNQLGVSRDKVEIEILHHPRRGLLGIGARRAKVRATLRESVMLDGEEFDMSSGSDLDDKPRRRRRRGGRNRGNGRDGDSPAAENAAAPSRPSASPGRFDGADRRGDGRRNDGGEGRGRGDGNRGRDDRRGGGRGRGDQRGGGATDGQARNGQETREARGEAAARQDGRDQRGGRAQQDTRGERPQERSQDRPQDARERGPRQPQREQGERRDRGRNRGRAEASMDHPSSSAPSASEAEATETPDTSGLQVEARIPQTIIPRRPVPSDEPPLDAAALEVIRVRADGLVRDLLAKMGFAAEVSSTVDEAAGEAVVAVRSENEGLLIGRRGQTLDSLEHIINRMALRETVGEGRVLLDIGDYRRRRRESLEELATRLRTRAVGERRTVQVSPMSPRDRKFFAQAFADDDSVEVRALGAGFYRRVIVAPAGMGAEALAAAAAGEDDSTEATFGDAEG